MDAYQVLQVNRGDTIEVIKKQYHKLAHLNHPDKGGSVDKMKEINAAWTWIQANYGKGGSYSGNFGRNEWFYEKEDWHYNPFEHEKAWREAYNEQQRKNQEDLERVRKWFYEQSFNFDFGWDTKGETPNSTNRKSYTAEELMKEGEKQKNEGSFY